MKLLKQFIQQETVLTAAAVLAVVSAFFVLPDAQYLGYIDLRTLAILFSLMTVMAGPVSYTHLHILEAENGQECLEKLRAETGNIALVLLDINMPCLLYTSKCDVSFQLR